jgi:hypothetical protein
LSATVYHRSYASGEEQIELVGRVWVEGGELQASGDRDFLLGLVVDDLETGQAIKKFEFPERWIRAMPEALDGWYNYAVLEES